MWRSCALSLALAACSFQHGALSSGGSSDDASIDGPHVISCGDLTCDPNAICASGPTGAACSCATGYAGDGMTCAAIDPCATANGGCPAACATTGPGTSVCYVPQTCADVASHKAVPNDSTVTLYASGNAAQPWTAFCHGGKEYLTAASATTNYGQYTQGGKSPGTNVRTTYARLRINPATLKIDICDQTFTTSTGTLSHDPAGNNPDISVTSMPLGVAMDCVGSNSQTGVAAINLSSLPFKIVDGWSTGGNSANGTSNSMSSNRIVALTGGGNCGWMEPSNGPFNPFNTCTGGELIAVVYAP